MGRTCVAALIPAHNEADTIAATVEAVLGIRLVTRVIVIDDGSTDDTAALARQAGAEVISCKRNLGKGAALQQGADALKANETEGDEPSASENNIVLLLDGDLGASASEAESLLSPVIDGLADMTIGVLPKPPGSGGFGVVIDLARGAIRDWGGGYDAQAPLSGQRALTWECFQAVLPFAEGYGVEVALTIRALQQNMRILEVMVDMQHRATGRDLPGFLHRAKQYLDIRHTIKHLQ
jgi:glycosyltransferase involved in cell wall biosynthesis